MEEKMNYIEKLDQYAELLVKIGINLQKDQPLVINAPIEAYDLVRKCTEHAYRAGASMVYVNYGDDQIKKLTLTHASEEALTTVPDHILDKNMYHINEGAGFISITGDDPELLKDVDPDRVHMSILSRTKKLKPFSAKLMNDDNPWLVAAYATPDWAKKIYPDLNEKEAVDKLWNDIFYACRVDETAVKNWNQHIDILNEKSSKLNEYQFKSLHYKSANGTDLTIELPKNHIWASAGSQAKVNNATFVANIPTEEVYTMPYRNGVNGTVYNSKPLNYNGSLIDDFWLKFKDGKVVEFDAKVGYDVLKNLLDSDEGSRYLGEVALVPYKSPISDLDILFYNTLFDENASCHLALGKAYPTNIQSGETMSDEELLAHGVNDSFVHEDFMVGTEDLSIIGTLDDGSEIQVFKNGNWAI